MNISIEDVDIIRNGHETLLRLKHNQIKELEEQVNALRELKDEWIQSCRKLEKKLIEQEVAAETKLGKFCVFCDQCGSCVRRDGNGNWIHICPEGEYTYRNHKVKLTKHYARFH